MLTRTKKMAATADRQRLPNNLAARVLVVDDEPIMTDLMRLLLRPLNLSVDTAHSGPEAVLYLEQIVYDVVVTDLQMPSMTGLQLAGWIRKHWPDTVLVIMTGCPEIGIYARQFPGLADCWIAKPFNRDQLLQVLRKFFHLPANVAVGVPVHSRRQGGKQRGVDLAQRPINSSEEMPITKGGWRCASTQSW
jgi:CheY-like chemotaxis protein